MKLRWQKHPVHPALVHFPIACWSLATIGDLASLYFGEMLWKLSGALLVIGTIFALVTMVSGLIEIAKIDEHSPAMKIVNLHMKLVMVTWCLYGTSLFLRIEESALSRPDLLEIGLSLSGFIFLLFASWYGATLVYEYKVGVRD